MEADTGDGGEMTRITRADYMLLLKAGIKTVRRTKRSFWMSVEVIYCERK
jgi:hypothetical protein